LYVFAFCDFETFRSQWLKKALEVILLDSSLYSGWSNSEK